MNPQAIYNDTETNTSYFQTWCDTRIEFNTTWMQTTPTWKYDLNACINWMPYNTYRYAFGLNTTKDTVDTTLDVFQHDFYQKNLCNFDNSSSYYPCQSNDINHYFNRMDCGQMLTSDMKSHNPSYFAYSESYRDTPDMWRRWQ